MQNELLNQWLLQQKELFGDTLYVSGINTEPKQDDYSSLDQFRKEIKDCQNCSLGESRTHFVFGVGNPDADLVFVGEAPGKNEDLQGEPFVGRAGKLLDKILQAIGLDRTKVYILNVLKCRPPKNRDPAPIEVEKCEPYLITQLNIIKPKLIVALGRVAANTLLKLDLPLGKMRNRLFIYEGIDLIATYHPAALLRNPNLKKAAWEDFKHIRDNYLTGQA